MIATIEKKQQDIATLCHAHGVLRLYVFGSALRDDFDPATSDVDFLVEFAPMDGHSKAHSYFDLLDDLRELLDTDVDLVMAGAVKNRYIARDIERTKQIVYAA